LRAENVSGDIHAMHGSSVTSNKEPADEELQSRQKTWIFSSRRLTNGLMEYLLCCEVSHQVPMIKLDTTTRRRDVGSQPPPKLHLDTTLHELILCSGQHTSGIVSGAR
jgi:hypothetical protein